MQFFSSVQTEFIMPVSVVADDSLFALILRTIMDRSCAATILSEVEQACNSVPLGPLQNNQAILWNYFGFCPR